MSQLSRMLEKMLGKRGMEQLVISYLTGNLGSLLPVLASQLLSGKGLTADDVAEAEAAVATLKRIARKLKKGG